MPVKAKDENTFDYRVKKQRRWEKEFPHLRCVEVPNPDKLQGDAANKALEMVNNYRNPDFAGVPYEVIPLEEKDLIRLCNSNMVLLMGADIDHWKALHKERISEREPDITTDVIY